MGKSATLGHIQKRQKQWADGRAIQDNRANGRMLNLADNLFGPLNPETVTEFKAADGDELGTGHSAAQMSSLHSSSVLVCNVFDYWRGRELAPLLRACGIQDSLNDLQFEQRFPTGLRGNPPNLDLLLSHRGKSPATAIEAKSTELFQPRHYGSFSGSYFRSKGLWADLERCQALAEVTNAQPGYQCLDAAQLLKHVLGLQLEFKAGGFELLYLWYDVPGSAAGNEHRSEVGRFSQAISPEVRFRSMTYQEMFESLFPCVPGTRYAAYLRSRYFPEASRAS
jgi:hypothetical protein